MHFSHQFPNDFKPLEAILHQIKALSAWKYGEAEADELQSEKYSHNQYQREEGRDPPSYEAVQDRASLDLHKVKRWTNLLPKW